MAQVEIQEEGTQTGRIQVPIEEKITPDEVHQKGVTAILGAIDKEESPTEAYAKATSTDDANGSVAIWNETTAKDRLDRIQETVSLSSSEDIQGSINSLADSLSGAVNNDNYQETIRSFPSSVGKGEATITKEAVFMQMRETMAKHTPRFSEMEIGDIAGSIGGILIPKRKAFTMTKLLTNMGFIDSSLDQADVLFDPTEEIVKLRNMFWQLDDEGQIEFMKLLSDGLMVSTDNPLIRSELIDNIIGGDFNESASELFEALDFVDIGATVSVVAKLGKTLAKSGKMLNFSRRTNEPTLSADIIEEAILNPEAAAKAGVTQADISDAVNPLINGRVGELITGAPDDTAASIQSTLQMQEARFKSITSEIERNGILDREGQADVMRAAEITQMEQPGVIEASVAQFDETGFSLTWTEAYFDTIGRLRKRKSSKTVDFTVNDVGDLKAPIDEWINNGILTLDPNARMKGRLRKWFVSDVEILARKQEMTAKAFDGMMKDAFKVKGKQLSKVEAANVEHALQAGSKEGRTYNFTELTEGATGRALSDREAQSYIATRNVVEKIYLLKNKQIVDNFLANGVKLYDGAKGILPVRAYDSWKAARTAWKQVGADSHHVLIPDGKLRLKGVEVKEGLIPFKGKRGLTTDMIKEAYDKGFILTRNHSGANLFRKGDVKTQWAFVKANRVVSPRGQQVINRIEGYMPRQRTEGFWFIKKNKTVGLSGAEDYQVKTTQAYSDTLEAAESWKAKQKTPDEFEIVFDREMTADERLYDAASTHGGMYAGARKSELLNFVGDGDEKFADTFEALQHYINHIGRQYPASLYRLGAEARLISMARDLGVTGRNLSLNNVLNHAKDKFATTSQEFKMLKGVHDQISFVNMIPTDEELAMAMRWRTVGKMFEGPLLAKVPGLKNAPKFFYQKAAKNQQPVDTIRGLTFNHLLGMYNPAQIIVQASGSLISFAFDPVGFGKHVSKAIGWGQLDLIVSDPIAQGKMLKWMRAKGLEEFADDYELWSKSGFRESVTQGNADYTSVFTKNLPYDAGILRKAAANHTMFYKTGELFNTRSAFATSISRYKKVHGVKTIDPNDAAALDEVGLWAEKFRLNMSRANQSEMNKGWKAAPLQFQQIISKYFEKVLPQVMGGTDEFTNWEKARLAIIPTIATGVVGIPMGQFVVTNVLDMAGIDETDLDEETTLAVKYGAIGWMGHEMLNLNTNFADRMTLGGDIIRNVWESLTTAKATWQWLGASGTVIDRYMRNGQYLAEAFDLTLLKNDDITFETISAIPAIIAEVATDIPSVSRNIKKYYSHLLTDNPAYIIEGKYMWDWETMNKKTAFFGMMGFQPTEMSEMYELNREITDSSTSFSAFGDTDADVIIRIMNTKLLNGATLQESKLYTAFINAQLKKYGPIEQMKLLNLIWEKSSSRRFDQDNLMYKFLLESESRQQEGLNILNTLVARKIEERK